MNHNKILKDCGFAKSDLEKGKLKVTTPIDGSLIAHVKTHTAAQAKDTIKKAKQAFEKWRIVPAPVRGELVRLLGEELRKEKENLGKLVTLENGKILPEGLGEVQEMIDICDFAVGLSRQLYGLTIASERPGHHMRETWQPLGVCGVITAFNFPVAVWAWNAALALVCGDPVIWKPSEKTPLTALACQKIFDRAVKRFNENHDPAPDSLNQILIGKKDIGEILVNSPNIPLISATGSTAMGRIVGEKVASRFGKSILELGGNNAVIVAPSADLDMAVRAMVFSAVGTAGQRCTTLRRLIVHEDVYDKLIPALVKAYESAPISNPLEKGTLIGPLIDKDAYKMFTAALKDAKKHGTILCGGTRTLKDTYADGYYVHPTIVEMPKQTDIVKHETFAPILYVLKYKGDIQNAIKMQNDVPQGLSSALFSTDVRECEYFLSASGSDCGIANINIGTSGAEIGGAFGGEKETGGGRESGSDSWKAYMRRMTSTVNYSRELPLAQGIKFGDD